jgi:hypothetical protein
VRQLVLLIILVYVPVIWSSNINMRSLVIYSVEQGNVRPFYRHYVSETNGRWLLNGPVLFYSRMLAALSTETLIAQPLETE